MADDITKSDEAVLEMDNLETLQRGSSRFQSTSGDLWDLCNADTTEVGSIKKSLGYEKEGNDLTSTTSTSTTTSTTTTSTSTSTTTSTSTSTSTS